MDVNTGTIADAEAMYWVILNVDIMNRAVPKHFTELNEVVRPESVVSLQCLGIAHASFDSLSHPSI